MNKLATAILIVLAFVALNIIMAGINFVGDNYSDVLGPTALLGSVVVLAIWLFKKGN